MTTKPSGRYKLAQDLHLVVNRAISGWAQGQAQAGNVLPGDTLAWTVVAALGIELLVIAQSTTWPMHKVMQAMKDVVTRPDAVGYVAKLLETMKGRITT